MLSNLTIPTNLPTKWNTMIEATEAAGAHCAYLSGAGPMLVVV